jgi:hypothetical protein
MAIVDTVTYKGIVFRRYPESKRWSDRSYFVPNCCYRRAGIGRLHEELWKEAHGPIPPGHHIHHRDGDPLNNDCGNLEALPRKEHSERHPWTPEKRRGAAAHLVLARQAAISWHRSPEGRAWHRVHGRATWANREAQTFCCQYCGGQYETTARRANLRFCSNKCKTGSRRRDGKDNETRRCVTCGQEFTINRYSKQRCCSNRCAQPLRRT